ncbi:hypothetical protein E2C01_075745 [Portunus trituberculatus]|uniref:Uncharacterized protein n=1 Tax=Portunus trituberculatus TaxID=210409 RepID=A0A5B7IL46_PORTR|nr:hypothetical protein [Portunus trituberculatus]
MRRSVPPWSPRLPWGARGDVLRGGSGRAPAVHGLTPPRCSTNTGEGFNAFVWETNRKPHFQPKGIVRPPPRTANSETLKQSTHGLERTYLHPKKRQKKSKG